MTWPLHDGTEHAGQVLEWLAPDTQQRYQDNLRDAKTRSMLEYISDGLL
jgi:hypothetical protein